MSASHKFELALHLKSIRNIGIRQGCFLQIRSVVYHKGLKNQNITAKPYQIINLQHTQIPKNQELTWAVLQDDTFLSPQIMVRSNDKNVNIDCMCLFKGQIALPINTKYQHEIYIYSQLIWFVGKEVEVIGEWKGYSKLTNFYGYIDIYFSSHLLTCSVSASAHCIISELAIQNEDKISPMSKQRVFFNHKTKNITDLYNAAIDPLIDSIQSISKWTRQFKKIQTYQNTQFGNNKNTLINQNHWKYNRLIKNLGMNSQQFFRVSLSKLNYKQFMENIKADAYNISSQLYQMWKNFLNLYKKYPQSEYMLTLQRNYHRCLQKDHWINRIVVVGDQKQPILKTFQPQIQNLQFCGVEQHLSKIKLSSKDMQLLSRPVKNRKQKLIVLVHGFQASSFDMEIMAMYFKFRNPNHHYLISEANQGLTQGVIQQCGHRLAIEIKNYINSKQLKDFSISLIGHSLGGVIIRASLRYLQLYKNNFECFVSICSPHIGYLYHTSTIVTTSMWVMNQVNKNQSMIQLTMSDNKVLNKCYIYQLSQRTQLTWFNTVIVIGSQQDYYVPFSSATLENIQFFYQSQSAKTYKQMFNSITKPIQDKIIRLEIIFNDRVKDLSGFIGRTAHIKVLSFLPIIDLYCHLISKRL